MPQLHLCPESLFSQNLSGRTYVVTGGNSGIGLATLRQLCRQGAHVVLACRRVAEGNRVQETLKSEGLKGSVEVMELNLASLRSVREFSQAFLKKHTVLHGLVNNAGIMNSPQGKTEDGFELQFGTNHLGHYLLTELLLPALSQAPEARVVNLSSCFHDRAMGREGRIDFEDLHFERRKYDGWTAYAQSKLANLLHARQLAKRLKGTRIVAVSVHPGWVRSNLIQFSMPLWMQNFVLRPVLKLAGMIEPWEGAQSSLYALLAPEVSQQSGAFFSQVGIYRTREAQLGGWPLHSPNPNAHDDVAAERLDQVSRRLVGLGN